MSKTLAKVERAARRTQVLAQKSSGYDGIARHTRPAHDIGGALVAVVLYLVLYGIYIAFQPRAFSPWSIASLMNITAPLALASAGQAFVVITKGYDLSLGGVVSIANVMLAVYPLGGIGGAAVSLLFCAFIGAAAGAINGFLVAYLRIQSIAATVGTMIVFNGVALFILNVPGGDVSQWISFQMTGRVFHILPVSGLFVAVVVLVWLYVRRTFFGISLYAIGRDETAAGMSGIKTVKARFFGFLCAGVLYGLAGFMLTANTATGSPTSGTPLLLLSFAAVVLGGVSLTGGKGGIFGAVMGAAVLMLIEKVLFSVGVSSFYTEIFQGAIVLVAVAINSIVAMANAVRERKGSGNELA